tara:strand:+ start:28208 stop:28777 length:570 start_codon:yes stop_codon:yes gene_type:complete
MMYSIRLFIRTQVVLIPLFFLLSCLTYESVSVRLTEKTPPGVSVPLLVGGFHLKGGVQHRVDLSGLRNSLELSLRERGFSVITAEESLAILNRAGLDAGRELTVDELLRISSRSPGRIWLQGYLDVQRTPDLAEDRWQLALGVQLIDLRDGQPIAETRVYGHDLHHVTDRVVFECTRRISDSIFDLLSP